jgi:Sulfatase
MTLTFIFMAAVGVVSYAERSVAYFALAIAAFCFVSAALLLVVADFERAILLSSMLAAAIAGASSVKHRHSGLKLIVTDLPLLFAGTVPFFFVQYPLAVAAVLGGSAMLILAATATLMYLAGPPVALELRVVLFGVALAGLAVAYRRSGGAAALQRIAAHPRCFFSGFVASLLDPLSWQQFGGLALSDIASDPLPLLAAVPARSQNYPDIIIIQHESIFDPRIYGLPVEPTVEALLSPQAGVHGRLNVDIFGGGSWQSEFSLLTGLSSASFGSNAYFLFKRGVGRFRNSLPHALSALGYRTMLASSCRRSFLNYDAFYRSIGVNERIFADDFPLPFDVSHFETSHSDAMFLQAALAAHGRAIAADPAPRFLYVLTNFNHGPHSRRLVAPGQFERERVFAAASLPDAQYAEYYARLAETAATWARLKSELSIRFPGRPTLVLHYGDHQPVMTRRIESKLRLAGDARRQFQTFYAIEALNGAADPLAHVPAKWDPVRRQGHAPTRESAALPGDIGSPSDPISPGSAVVAGPGADLDIAFLGTVALQRAGLPLDGVFATRASLLEQCGEAYFASSSERKRRFHRTLVELGMIDLTPTPQQP